MSHRLKHMVKMYIDHMLTAKKLEDNGMKFPGSRICVMTDEAPDVTSGGIHIPDSVIKGAPAVGTVVGVGVNLEPDEYTGEIPVVIGHRCALAKYGGTRVELYLDGADEKATEVQLIAPNDLYIFWDPRIGTELDGSDES